MRKSIVYRKAAERIFKKEEGFCCTALSEISIHYGIATSFPEFYLFRPTREELDGEGRFGAHYVWFGRDNIPENVNRRVIALLFAAEMCND